MQNQTILTGQYQVQGVRFHVENATRGVRILRATATGKTFPVAGVRTDGTVWYRTETPTTRALVAQLLDDTEAAKVAEVATCTRCHRELTDPTSIARLLGPECAEQVA